MLGLKFILVSKWGPLGICNRNQIGKALNGLKKNASEMLPIVLGLSDYLYRKYMTDTISRYFNCETDKCLMHIKIWP